MLPSYGIPVNSTGATVTESDLEEDEQGGDQAGGNPLPLAAN